MYGGYVCRRDPGVIWGNVDDGVKEAVVWLKIRYKEGRRISLAQYPR